MTKMLLLAATLIFQGGPAAPRSASPIIQYGAISGRIFSTNGTPAAGVRVSAVEAETQAPGASVTMMSIALTDEAGRFRLEGIPNGRYYIAVGRAETPTYFPGTLNTGFASRISVSGGDTLMGIDFRMLIPPPMKVSGRVNRPFETASNPQSVPARGANTAIRVRLTGPRSMMIAAGPDGAFEFPDVPAGEYELSVLPADASMSPVRISVVDQDVRNIQVGIPAARIEIKTSVDEEGPFPRFHLVVTELENAANPALVKAGEERMTSYSVTGALTLFLQPGTYRIKAERLPQGYSVKTITLDTEPVTAGPFKVTHAVPMNMVLVLGVSSPHPWARVTGRVTARDGQTAATRVELNGASLVAPVSAAVRPDGSFEFQGVLFGDYVARVSPSAGYFPKSISFATNDPPPVVIAPPTAQEIVGDFAKIQPGEFSMGCSPGDGQCLPEEFPPHRVRITKPFEIGRFEVTQLQWETVMGSNPSQYKGEDRPVEMVNSWEMVEAFLAKVNALHDGFRYRMPTEAEWEYAARAGSTAAFGAPPETFVWNLNILLSRAGNVVNGSPLAAIMNGGGLTSPVGQLQPNAWGLYDMQGNAWEWVSDWYGATYYAESPVDDPKGPESGALHVLKGGSAVTPADTVRASTRGNRAYLNNTYIYGLRLVREPVPQ